MATVAELLQQKIQAASAKAVQTAGAIKDASASNTANIEAIIQGISASSSAAQKIAEEEFATVQQVEQSKARMRDAAGGEAKTIQGIEAVVQGADRVNTLTQEVVRKQNRSIFDLFSDPIGLITDVVTLEKSEQELKGQVATTSAALTGVQQRHQVLTMGFQEAEQSKITATTAKLAAVKEKAAAELQVEIAKANLEGTKYNLQGIKDVQQLSITEVELAGKALNAQQAEQQMRLAREAAARDAQRLALARQEASLRAKAMQEGVDDINRAGQLIRAGAAATGMDLPQDQAAMRLMVREAMGNPNSQAAQFYWRGVRNSTPGQGSRIGTTPADSLDILGRETTNLPKELAATQQVLTRALEVVNKPGKGGAPAVDRKKDPAAWEKAYNDATDKVLADMYGEVIPGSGNLADIGRFVPGVLQTNPDLAALPVTKKFLAPLVATGNNLSDPRQYMKLGVTAVAQGKMTSEEFLSGMPAIMQKTAMLRVQEARVGDFGLVPPKAGRTYNVRMEDGQVYDLTQRIDLQRWMAKELGRQATMGSVIGNRISSPFVMN
jgi:hypothetical protein